MSDDKAQPADPDSNGVDPRSLSPELALVDPAAAREGRRTLPGIVLTEDAMQTKRREEPRSEEQAIEEIRRHFTGPEAAAHRHPLLRPRVLAPVAIAAAVVAGALWLHSMTSSDPGSKASSHPAVPSAPTSKTHKPTSTQTTSPPPTHVTRSIPDFVWVPVKGAARYRVQFVRGGRVILTTTTGAARLHVAAAKLPPGTYRWKVWPLTKGGTAAGAAVVNASVKIR